LPIELSQNGATAILFPEYGGRLHQLFIPAGGGVEPLLVCPYDPSDYREHPTRGGSFPMAPWPNRIREGRFAWAGREWEVPLDGKPNAIHGRVHTVPWRVIARTARVCEMEAPFDEGWPWEGKAWQRFELRDHSLLMKLELRSAREPFPAGCGWHPWFRRDVGGSADVHLSIPATRRYVLRDQLPTGELAPMEGIHDLRHELLGDRRIDDCYTGLAGPVDIDWGRVSLRMTLDCTYPHVQVYTPPEAFCVEPQSCAPDAFNLAADGSTTDGMAIARPGNAVSIACEWAWSTR
jgi:aldose 1-epimerase